MIGFIIILCSILLAYNSPAKSYELSIYASTPIAFWIGIITVIFVSLIVSFNSNSKQELTISLLLAGAAIISIVFLPIIRNYYYFGLGDSISHLGLANSILIGNIDVGEIFYPAIHLLGVFISSLTGLPLRTSMMLNITLFAGIFLLFIPLVLKNIHGKFNKDLMIIGVYSAFMLLPINNISIHFQPHPSTQAVLFAPALVYLFLKYNSEKSYRFLILYILFFLGILFIHPQQALAFILLISTIFVWSRWYSKDKSYSIRIPLLFGLIFWMWVGYTSTFQSNIRAVFSEIFYGRFNTAEDVLQRGVSLSYLGSSIEEVIVKIFFLTLLFTFLTVVYLLKRKNYSGIDKNLIFYFVIGILPISIIVVIYLILGEGASQAPRYIGMIQMIITITGAYSFFHLTRNIKWAYKKTLIFAFISICIILSSNTIFPSPYIYLGNSQVTQSTYEGYTVAFTNYNESLKFGSVRMHSYRFYATTQGVPEDSIIRDQFLANPLDHFNNQSLSTYYESKTYLAITETEVKQDAELYKGFRFSYDDFMYLERDPNINKVQTNGDFNLFLISPKLIANLR